MEFQLQNVYLIYTWLIVYVTLNLTYFKEHVYYILLIYSITSLFWNLLCSSMIHDYVTVTCDRCVTIMCNIMLTSSSKSENQIKMRNEMKSTIFNSNTEVLIGS